MRFETLLEGLFFMALYFTFLYIMLSRLYNKAERKVRKHIVTLYNNDPSDFELVFASAICYASSSKSRAKLSVPRLVCEHRFKNALPEIDMIDGRLHVKIHNTWIDMSDGKKVPV